MAVSLGLSEGWGVRNGYVDEEVPVKIHSEKSTKFVEFNLSPRPFLLFDTIKTKYDLSQIALVERRSEIRRKGSAKTIAWGIGLVNYL